MSSRRDRTDRARPRPGPGRDEHVVAGERAVAELVEAAPGRIRRILVDRARMAGPLATAARAAGVEVVAVEPAALADAAGAGPAKGAVAFAAPPPLHELDDLCAAAMARPQATLVALDQVVDPHNLGAILRSAEFFGAVGAFWPKDGGAPLSGAAVRASAGATERLPLGQVTNLARALDACKDAGLWIVGTVPEGGMPLREAIAGDRLPAHRVLVFGGEHDGMRRLTRERCDFLVTIERGGRLASLNVSAAAAVVLAALQAEPTPTGR